MLGRVAAMAMPKLTREIAAGEAVDRHPRFKRAILEDRLEKASRAGDTKAVQKILHAQWQHRVNDQYYSNTHGRYTDWFLGPHYASVEALIAQANETPYEALIEIGCGGGQALSHYAEVLPELERLTGLDINPKIIAKNGRTYASQPKLAFECANALTRVPELLGPNTILSTYGGVLEYFSKPELVGLLRALAAHPNTALSIVEPVDLAHDYATQAESYLFGGENSFSHNYRDIIEQAGLAVRFDQEDRTAGHRFQLMLAVSP